MSVLGGSCPGLVGVHAGYRGFGLRIISKMQGPPLEFSKSKILCSPHRLDCRDGVLEAADGGHGTPE